MQFTVIIEKGATSWGAYVPDLPGCIAAGDSREEALRLIREAIEFHVEGLIEQGESVPEPHSFSALVGIDAACQGVRVDPHIRATNPRTGTKERTRIVAAVWFALLAARRGG